MDSFKNTNRLQSKKNSPFTIASIAVLAVVMAFFLFTEDSGGKEAIKWLLAVFAISTALRPMLQIRALKFWDNGFGLSFGLGLALSFFTSWFLSACKITQFDTPLVLLVTALMAVVFNLLSYRFGIFEYRWKEDDAYRHLWGFAVFCLIFLAGFWIIGFNPGVDSGTENYMDFGFMQAIYRQKTVAPFDVWMSGEKLNYYYLGQAAAVFLCRASFTTPEYGYNFMLCTFWGMTFLMTGEIAYGVVNAISEYNECEESKTGIRAPAKMAAIVASFLSAFGANGHWLVYGIVKPLVGKITGSGAETENYWFPEPTVYISTYAGDPDNGKNEFPAYSAILGDLHAHVLNVIFVLPLVALMLDYAFSKSRKKYTNLVLPAILLGLFKGSNYWDFAIYFVITGAIVVFCDIKSRGFNIKSLRDIAIKALMVTAVSNIVILPFTLSFKKMASKIFFARVHSPILKMLVLWGIPVVITLILITWLCLVKNKKTSLPGTSREGLLAFMLCTIGLVITPEVLYIQDIYGEENARFNTMFKLTYQAFILFGIIVGITAGIMILEGLLKNHAETNAKRGKTADKHSPAGAALSYTLAGVIAIITLLLSGYTVHAVNDWFGNVFNKDYRRSISSLECLYNDPDYYYEMRAKEYLDADSRPVINIVEAAGDSYTHESALSILSGTCAPVGWYVHEWMWRDDGTIVEQRGSDVSFFYECGNESYCWDFLQKYNVDYIFVGPAETNKYIVNYSGFENMGTVLMDEDTDRGRMMLIRIES